MDIIKLFEDIKPNMQIPGDVIREAQGLIFCDPEYVGIVLPKDFAFVDEVIRGKSLNTIYNAPKAEIILINFLDSRNSGRASVGYGLYHDEKGIGAWKGTHNSQTLSFDTFYLMNELRKNPLRYATKCDHEKKYYGIRGHLDINGQMDDRDKQVVIIEHCDSLTESFAGRSLLRERFDKLIGGIK